MSTKTITIPVPFVLSRARWVALGLAAGLVVAAIASPAFSPRQLLAADPATSDEHTVSVAGSGRVILSPDTADLRLGVTATAKTVKDARAQAAEAMTAVLASLRELGIADRDMQTTVLSLQPVYDYTTSPKPPRLTGYSLTNAISVTIRDLAKVGDAIDDALAAGATSLDGVTFRVADQTAARHNLLGRIAERGTGFQFRAKDLTRRDGRNAQLARYDGPLRAFAAARGPKKQNDHVEVFSLDW